MLECKVCHITLSEEDVLKYNNVCPCCHTQNSFYEEYILDIKRVSTDESFVNAMIKLKSEDPIEYQLKMNQFAMQKEQQKQLEQGQKSSDTNVPKCPTCQSTNLKKITVTSKAMNTAMFGIFGKKRHKTFHCNNCGYEW